MIKRYYASQDSTITNQRRLVGTASKSNLGASDTLEIFSFFDNGNVELSRILIKFDIDSIIEDRNNGLIPVTGEVTFLMHLFNVRHSETIPNGAIVHAYPLTRDWVEGYGKEIDDNGFDANGYGVNWLFADDGVEWTNPGGDFGASVGSKLLKDGNENIRFDITSLVESWITSPETNFGLCIALDPSQEIDNGQKSFYTKRVSSRSSEYFFSLPNIEARWDSSIEDDRNSYNFDSPLANVSNKVFFFNRINGELTDLPSNNIYVSLHEDLDDTPILPVITGTHYSDGIYYFDSAISESSISGSYVYDAWHFQPDASDEPFYVGRIEPEKIDPMANILGIRMENYSVAMPRLKPAYSVSEKPELRVLFRKNDYGYSIFSTQINEHSFEVLKDVHYKINMIQNNLRVLDYDITNNSSKLSYDKDGNFFEIDMSLLKPGYAYLITFAKYNNKTNSFDEFRNQFRFRVEKDEEIS